MSFNKRKHLETNIEAIKIAFELENSQVAGNNRATGYTSQILRIWRIEMYPVTMRKIGRRS